MDETTRVIEITSPEPEQGKSTVVANLAVAFANIGIPTIVLDADLRRPRQHEIFGLDNSTGLSTVLALGRKPELKPAGSGLWVITSGPVPPDPTEMLHIRLPSVIKALRRRKALILIDTPPVLPVSDARLVAPLTDGVILLATAGTQKPAQLPGRARPPRARRQQAARRDPQQGRRRRHGDRRLLPLRGQRGARRPGARAPRLQQPSARGVRARTRAEARRTRGATAIRATGGAGLGGGPAARQPPGLPRGCAGRSGARRRRVAAPVHGARGRRRRRCCWCSCSCAPRRCCSCSSPRCPGKGCWPTRPRRSPRSRSSASCCSGPGSCGRSCAPSRCG